MNTKPKKIVVLASGRGSNFEAIAQAIESGKVKGAEIVALICNIPNAPVLKIAENKQIPFTTVSSLKFKKDRIAYDNILLDEIKKYQPDLICLAGYMRIIGKSITQEFPNKIINIHPSLLPKFKGLNAQKQALDAGEKTTGCTVHFVNEELDSGKIILQKQITILKEDTVETLTQRLLPIEHKTYIEALQILLKF